uniref:Uncharacterized protein n=1 Tax=Paramormyrops kingsleyae TaxID=1676925 RepID=A0A3B3R465_9TELE
GTLPERPEVDALAEGAAVQAEVQVVVVAVLGRARHLLRHAHRKRQVAAHLPHHHGGADVARLDLHMLARDLLQHAQRCPPMALAAVARAVGEGGRQLVGLRVVRLLIHALLENSELHFRIRHCRLAVGERKTRVTSSREVRPPMTAHQDVQPAC